VEPGVGIFSASVDSQRRKVKEEDLFFKVSKVGAVKYKVLKVYLKVDL
jgi:hypothetical protein